MTSFRCQLCTFTKRGVSCAQRSRSAAGWVGATRAQARGVTPQTDSCIVLLGCWLSAPQKFFDGEADVPSDLSQNWVGEMFPGSVEGNRCASAVSMPELLVGSTLTNFRESERLEERDYLARLQDRD